MLETSNLNLAVGRKAQAGYSGQAWISAQLIGKDFRLFVGGGVSHKKKESPGNAPHTRHEITAGVKGKWGEK